MSKSVGSFKDDNDARRARIRSVCERHRSYRPLYHPTSGLGRNLPTLNRESMQCNSKHCPIFVDDSRSLAFCFISKVASTTFKRIFAPLLNITVTGNDFDAFHWSFHSQTLRFAPRTLVYDERSNYTKALFVRHPFERLVSTYIDKTPKGPVETEWAYKTYWNKIPGVLAENRSPTFSEFVEFVLATTAESSDDHWSPYYAQCHPCLLDYDFVGKLETADRDFPLFFSVAGIVGKTDVPHAHSRHNGSVVNVTDTKQYFRQLSFGPGSRQMPEICKLSTRPFETHLLDENLRELGTLKAISSVRFGEARLHAGFTRRERKDRLLRLSWGGRQIAATKPLHFTLLRSIFSRLLIVQASLRVDLLIGLVA
ncbi:hypothetical protein HPB50_014051 [Hyalomma asiaticum]|uniref:Uncharacterized protein n=1 Tax=Hyalomma asiaticum TaxID=266040 RepID=A0ACB7T0F3_HYAAI|nr:hypothetical protein HPB50_014051 [Hyalomma asiaticum]